MGERERSEGRLDNKKMKERGGGEGEGIKRKGNVKEENGGGGGGVRTPGRKKERMNKTNKEKQNRKRAKKLLHASVKAIESGSVRHGVTSTFPRFITSWTS